MIFIAVLGGEVVDGLASLGSVASIAYQFFARFDQASLLEIFDVFILVRSNYSNRLLFILCILVHKLDPFHARLLLPLFDLLLVHAQIRQVLPAVLPRDVPRDTVAILLVLHRQVLIRLEHDRARHGCVLVGRHGTLGLV